MNQIFNSTHYQNNSLYQILLNFNYINFLIIFFYLIKIFIIFKVPLLKIYQKIIIYKYPLF